MPMQLLLGREPIPYASSDILVHDLANVYILGALSRHTLQEKLVLLTGEKSKLDADAQEAKAAQRRTEVEKLQLQLVNDNLANNNKWLEENLSQMTSLMKSERQKTTHEVMPL